MPAGLNPDQILKELSRLWSSLGRQAESGDSPGVLRACAMTLIVLAEHADDPAAIGQTLAEVMREHPHRAILLRLAPGSALPEARITAQCWMPFGRRQQICCEQIEIAAGESQAGNLAPVLAALRAPDLPVVLWFRSPRLFPWHGFREPQKKLIDSAAWESPRWILNELARGGGIADLAWARVTRWREIVAQAYESEAMRPELARISGLRVFFGGERPPTAAFYLAGWVSASLDRQLETEFVPVGGRPAGGIEGLEVFSPGRTFSARRSGEQYVEIQADSRHACTSSPRPGEAALLGEELRLPGRDPVYDKAVIAAAALAGR